MLFRAFARSGYIYETLILQTAMGNKENTYGKIY